MQDDNNEKQKIEKKSKSKQKYVRFKFSTHLNTRRQDSLDEFDVDSENDDADLQNVKNNIMQCQDVMQRWRLGKYIIGKLKQPKFYRGRPNKSPNNEVRAVPDYFSEDMERLQQRSKSVKAKRFRRRITIVKDGSTKN